MIGKFYLFIFLFSMSFVDGMNSNSQNCQQLAKNLHELVNQHSEKIDSIDTLKQILEVTREFNNYNDIVQQGVAQYFCFERAGCLLVDVFSKSKQGKFFTDKKNACELSKLYDCNFRDGLYHYELIGENYLVITQKNTICVFDKTSKKICWAKRLEENLSVTGIRWCDTGKLLVSTDGGGVYKYNMYNKNYQHFREVLIDELVLYATNNGAGYDIEILKKLVDLYEFPCLIDNSSTPLLTKTSREVLEIVERFKTFKKKCVESLENRINHQKQLENADNFEDESEDWGVPVEEID